MIGDREALQNFAALAKAAVVTEQRVCGITTIRCSECGWRRITDRGATSKTTIRVRVDAADHVWKEHPDEFDASGAKRRLQHFRPAGAL